MTPSAEAPPVILSTTDLNAPDLFIEEDGHQSMRDLLARRINLASHPSRLINQVCLADLRCAESAKVLAGLIGRAPKVLSVIRAELYKAFGINPDCLLFTETRMPLTFRKVSSLTDRALLLLAQPYVSININQFTVLSFKDEPARQFPHRPREVLERVIALNLFERLASATDVYWQGLACGSALTRQGLWGQMYASRFADRAFVARQLNEVSSEGLVVVQALVDAPTAQARQRAGGAWASVRVCKVLWPGVYQTPIPIPGALHIYREGDPLGTPHVIYLPGLPRNFYEFQSFRDVQCGLLSLISSPLFDEFWQCMSLRRRHELCVPADLTPASTVIRGSALMGDVLQLSALALLEGQWDNELACAIAINHSRVFAMTAPRPQVMSAARFLAQIEKTRQQLVGGARLGVVRDELLDWDQQRRRPEIVFASASLRLALRTVQHQIKGYEKSLIALMNLADLSQDTPAYKEFLTLENQYKVYADALYELTRGAQERLFEFAFWTERPGGADKRYVQAINAQSAALRCRVQVLDRLKRLPVAHRDMMLEVLDKPLAAQRQGSATCIFSVAVGAGVDFPYPLYGVFVVTAKTAPEDPFQPFPVVLCALGREGGVATFSSLDALSQGLRASLNSLDDSVLWRCIGRDQRKVVRGLGASLVARYQIIYGNPVHHLFKGMLRHYARLHRTLAGGARLFTEVGDSELSRLLLGVELQEHLQAPASGALDEALASVDLVRKAAHAAQIMPQWLASASAAQHKQYRRLLHRYLSSALAFERALAQRLPDLHTFARRALITRLSQDGIYPQLDIDTPVINLPDDVVGSFCSADPRCPVGDRSEILTPSLERTSFSLLQLALHNLDPKAPYTRWRLSRAVYLQPGWQQKLSADYLIKTLSTLDIGGHYDRLIMKAFYPPVTGQVDFGEGRTPALLNRALQEGAQMQLFSAARQGLTVQAQNIFSTAMAARTAGDLQIDGYSLKLSVVHLVGHTMEHDRYIAAIVVMHDQGSGQCVVYWPAAPPALVITEYASVQAAQAALNRLGALPGNVKTLARQVAPGWAFEAITHETDNAGLHLAQVARLERFFFAGGWRKVAGFVRSFSIKHLVPSALANEIETQINEQIGADPLRWLAIVPTSHTDAGSLLYLGYVQDLQRQAQATCNSGQTLDKYRVRRLDTGDAIVRGVLSFFSPLFASGNQFYELLLAARRYHRSGDPRDAVDVGFMAAFVMIDLLLNFLPGGKVKKPGPVALRATTPLRNSLSRIQRFQLSKPGRFLRFSKVNAPSPLTQLKPLERFKLRGVLEDAIELKGPGHEGIYVKDGQQFVMDDAHHYPVYQRDNESLFRLKNLQNPGQDELVLNIHQPAEWLLGADAPEPQPGPSSRVVQFGQPPPSPAVSPVEWHSSSRNLAAEWARRAHNITSFWRAGGLVLEPGRVTEIAPGRSLYRVRGAIEPHLKAGALFFETLPAGSQPYPDMLFVRPPGPLIDSIDSMTMRLGANPAEQPVPFTYGEDLRWTPREFLFRQPLPLSVENRFPGMTPASRQMAARRLVELADPSGETMTATRLLNIRATLDKWVPGVEGGMAQTDELLTMLRPMRPRRNSRSNLQIGVDGQVGGFERMDFYLPHALDRSFFKKPKGVNAQTYERLNACIDAVTRILQAQGFRVEKLITPPIRRFPHLVCTHSASDNLYYIVPKWIDGKTVDMKIGRARLLSRAWFDDKNSHYPALYQRVREASDQRRLVKLFAGIQNVEPPSVYFLRPADL